jgi:hypothetical protein
VYAENKGKVKPTIYNNTFNTLAYPFAWIAIGEISTEYMGKNEYGMF